MSVSYLSDDEIYQKVSNIVASFKLLECYECATAIVRKVGSAHQDLDMLGVWWAVPTLQILIFFQK
ncbi:hypothetical protein CAL7716_069820 [Calothrix sp. PCC 7716]|nr:hypothetical protein CAL7716_069820 [Calothrix sp. PCC 7716]